MEYTELISRLAVSLAIGLLVGLERGWRARDEEEHQRVAGLRTFALSGLLGGVTGAISLKSGGLVIGLVCLGYTGAIAAFYWLEAQVDRTLSVTSVVAGMLTFLLGAMAVAGELQPAIAGAVAMTVLLAFREYLHRWLKTITWMEIRAVLILLAMSFLLLPVLPNRTIDPWDALNPYEIWLLAILIAAISFAGYVGVRVFGDRLGGIATAVAGGLASSTATTLAFARLARQSPQSSNLLAAGIAIASLVMMVRVGVVASALNQRLLPLLAPPLAGAALTLAIGAAVLLLGQKERKKPKLEIRNPLELSVALKLAALIALILLAAELLRRLFGSLGIWLLAGISGIADVDAVTISLARLARGEIDLATGATGILLAVAVNTISKAILSAWAGGRKIGVIVALVSAVALLG